MDEPWVEADLRDGAESIINMRSCSQLVEVYICPWLFQLICTLVLDTVNYEE